MAVLTLEVATPTGLALRTEADSVQAPSVDGEFGVLPGHIPLLAALRCGLLHYRLGDKRHVAAVGTGFVEAEPDKVLLLTDSFAMPADIDAGSVSDELEEANKALQQHYTERKAKEAELLKGDDEKQIREAVEALEFAEEELKREIEWASARLEAKKLADKTL